MMKRHILLGLVLAAGAAVGVQAKSDDAADVSSKPSQLQDRAMRQEAAQRLAGLMQQSKWLSERNKERLFDMVASDETRQELQQQIAALQEQKEELDAMKVTKMSELESLEAGTTAHNMKEGEIKMLDEQIMLVEKKIASLVSDKGYFSREQLYALGGAALFRLYHTGFKKDNILSWKNLFCFTVAFAFLEYVQLGRNSMILGKALGSGVPSFGDILSKAGQAVFGKGGYLDSFEQWVEDSVICPANDWFNDTIAGGKSDIAIVGIAAAVLVGLYLKGRN